MLTLFHICSILLCAIYYVAWIYILPKLQHYSIRPEILSVGGSAATHRLVKVPDGEVGVWVSTHDASGRLIADGSMEKVAESFKE